MAALFLISTSSSEEKAFLDLVTATAESSVPSQSAMCFLPAGLTRCLNPTPARHKLPLICQPGLEQQGWDISRYHLGKQDKSGWVDLSVSVKAHSARLRPCRAHPALSSLTWAQGAALQGQGEPSASPSCHPAHTHTTVPRKHQGHPSQQCHHSIL